MPEIEIQTADRKRVDSLIDFVRRELADMPVEARQVFTVEIFRVLKPEIAQLRTRTGK